MAELYTMQSILKQNLAAYQQQHRLNPRQRQVCHHILACRTAALGGMQLQCGHCGDQPVLHFACRDRHCPRCQRKASEQWSARQRLNVLPVTYHHLVFTLPHSLNPWLEVHPRELYALLFESVWATLSAFGHKRLSGRMGMVAVLHTWGENISRHVHLHCLVPGGALNDGGDWRPSKGDYLFPVKALSRHFRGGYVSRLHQRIERGQFPRLNDPQQRQEILDRLMASDWVVYSKPCLHHANTVVDYLARYSHRIALSDRRIEGIDNQGRIQLSYKDYRENGQRKWMVLHPEELIRRFLLHVLPKGFMRIRHYGFLANRCRNRCLSQIRNSMTALPSDRADRAQEPACLAFDGYPCPKCRQGQVRVIAYLPPLRFTGG